MAKPLRRVWDVVPSACAPGNDAGRTMKTENKMMLHARAVSMGRDIVGKGPPAWTPDSLQQARCTHPWQVGVTKRGAGPSATLLYNCDKYFYCKRDEANAVGMEGGHRSSKRSGDCLESDDGLPSVTEVSVSTLRRRWRGRSSRGVQAAVARLPPTCRTSYNGNKKQPLKS